MSSIADVQTANWILTGAATVLTAGRLGIRFSTNRRLRADDCIHLFALILLIIHGAMNQVTLAAKADQKVDVASDLPTDTLLHDYYHLHVLNTVNNVFLYAIMWVVKIAFLFLYREVFRLHKGFLWAWWAVLAFAVLSYIPPFAMVVHTCAGATTLTQYKACNSGTPFRTAKLITTCVLNVVSDVAIMALPLWMLSQLQMSLKNKIGLAMVFCVALFCIALDILRTAEAVDQNQDLYTVIEVNFTVIVFCLPAYRRLLVDKKMLSSWRSSFGSSKERFGQKSTGLNSTRRTSSATSEETAIGTIREPSKMAILSHYQSRSLTDVESQDEIVNVMDRDDRPTGVVNQWKSGVR